MPTYHYRCNNCGFEEEIFQRMTDNTLTTCTKCGAESYERVISGEGGFVLKGSGFHSTDYCGSKAPAKSPEAGGGCSSGTCPYAK